MTAETPRATAETPDPIGAFPRLDSTQIEGLERAGERRPTREGEVLFRQGDPTYDFYVVLDGLVAIVDRLGAADERLITTHGPGRFLGEINLLTGQAVLFTAIVREAGEVLVVPRDEICRLVVEDEAFGDVILRAYLLRRSMAVELGAGLRVVGSRYSPDTRRIRDFLARNRMPHTWLDLEEHRDAEALLRVFRIEPEETPIVIQGDQVLRNPSNSELAAALGLRPLRPSEEVADLLVVGAGPAGLAASVYGSSEGLVTVLLEAVATGGQASTSSRIENYLGFPAGLSGSELAERAAIQTRKFGTHIVVPADATALHHEDGYDVVTYPEGRIQAKCIVLATGARYRRLNVPRLERYEGNGVYYAATAMEARECGLRPVVVGGGNSAGQATVFLADRTDGVRLLIRSGDLDKSMSRYLVDRIERHPRVEVLLHSEVRELLGEDWLEAVVVEHTDSGERRTLDTTGLFVFIGADPCTAWLAGQLAVDRHGFLLTGADAERAANAVPDDRHPFMLETSRPGIFAAGDVRSGSVKRVASAVGEGSMAVQFVHRHLAARS